MFLLFSLISSMAHANTWQAPAPNPLEIKSTLGAPESNGVKREVVVDYCKVGINGCVAADAGHTYASTWSKVTCHSALFDDPNSSDEWVVFRAEFNSGVDANGWTDWPEAWPSSVDCKRVMGPSNHTHGYTISINPDPSQATKYEMPVSTTVYSTTSTIPFVLPSNWTSKLKIVNIPDGTYTGAATTGLVSMKTTSGGSMVYTETGCRLLEGVDDYVVIFAADQAIDGDAYCQVTKDGNPVAFKVNIDVQ